MGKRKGKKRKAPPKKPKLFVPTQFDCPFCNHEGTVECLMERKVSTASLTCRTCTAHYRTNVSYLSEPVDVYSEWIDQCHEAAKKARASGAARPRQSQQQDLPGAPQDLDQYEDEEEGDEVLDDVGVLQGRQQGEQEGEEEDEQAEEEEEEIVEPAAKRAKTSSGAAPPQQQQPQVVRNRRTLQDVEEEDFYEQQP